MTEMFSKALRLFLKKLSTSIYSLFYKTLVINGFFRLNRWGTSLKPSNLGDDLNVPLLEWLSGRKIRFYKTLFRKQKNIMAIGSVIDLCANSKSIVWGSGAIDGKERLKEPPLKVFAVRGPLTREYLVKQGISCPPVFGDPALLLPKMYTPSSFEKKYRIGIIPHYKDQKLPAVKDFLSNYKDVLLIKMRGYQSWQSVIDQICSCESIISSSLHGLILSDAYGVPNVRIRLSDALKGGDFKFRDYYAGINKPYVDPVDCRDKIDIQSILSCIVNYSPVQYDSTELLRSWDDALAFYLA